MGASASTTSFFSSFGFFVAATARQLDVLAVLEELDDLNGLAGADDDVPVGQLVLDLALHNGDLAGDDERAVVDLLVQLELIEELLDGAGGELAGGPCRQDGHAGASVMSRLTGTLERSISPETRK